MPDPIDKSTQNLSADHSSAILDRSKRVDTVLLTPPGKVLPPYSQTNGVILNDFLSRSVSSGSVSPVTTCVSLSSYSLSSDSGNSKDYLDLPVKESRELLEDSGMFPSMVRFPSLASQDAGITLIGTEDHTQDYGLQAEEGMGYLNTNASYAVFSPFLESDSLKKEGRVAPVLSHAADMGLNMMRPIGADEGPDLLGAHEASMDVSDYYSHGAASYNQKDVMMGYAESLGYFPTMQEWDTILSELGDIEKIEVGKTTYNVSVAKDFLKTTMAAFCYLGREKKVNHNPSLFNTLVEELFGARFKSTDHAIKIWQNVFIQFNAIRVVLSMKADKARKDDKRQGLVKTSPVTERLTSFLELVREFEKDLWRALPADKKQSLRANFAKSKDKVAISHLDAVALGSPQRRSRLERSSGSPLLDVSRSTSPSDDTLSQRMSDTLSVDLSKKEPLHQDLFGDPSIQRHTYRELSGSHVLGYKATSSSKVAALKNKLEHYNNGHTSVKTRKPSSPSGKASCSSRKN